MADQLGGYWKLAGVLKSLTKQEPKSRGTATVRDVDNEGIVWVTPSGTDEAVPAAGVNVVSVSVGDVVTVENNGGRLSIVGNATEPAVGTSYVRGQVKPVAEKAEADARDAHDAADEAQGTADLASDIANAATALSEYNAGAIEGVLGDLSNLGTCVRVDDSGVVPVLYLGAEDSDIYAILTNSALTFTVIGDDRAVAIIGADTEGGLLDVTRAILQRLGIHNGSYAGSWEWQQRANGHLTLKYIATA